MSTTLTNVIGTYSLMKSIFDLPHQSIMLSEVIQRFRSATSKITRATKMAVNILIKMPRIRVTAKPLSCSLPIT